jgi:hypothetical protein
MGSHGRSASLQRLFHIKFFDLAVSFSPLPQGGSFHKVPCPSISSPSAASQDWIVTVAWRSAFWTLKRHWARLLILGCGSHSYHASPTCSTLTISSFVNSHLHLYSTILFPSPHSTTSYYLPNLRSQAKCRTFGACFTTTSTSDH